MAKSGGRLPRARRWVIPPGDKRHCMFWSRRNREAHRYYLLPGMGRSNRRKHREFLFWSVIVGLIASALFAYLLYTVTTL